MAGVPSVFIRLAGCPLRCRWCDTKYAWVDQAGADYNIDEVIEAVGKWSCSHIVLTGGEPMICPELSELSHQLKTPGRHITIETAGIAFVPDLPCDLMSISPKLSNSTPDDSQLAQAHEAARLNIPVIRELIAAYEYQLKFVVDSADDLPDITKILHAIGDINPIKVMLMPQSATREELLAKSPIVAELCKQKGFTFCPRLQVLLWDTQRGV